MVLLFSWLSFFMQALETCIFQQGLAKLHSTLPEALSFKTIVLNLPMVFKTSHAAGDMWFNF